MSNSGRYRISLDVSHPTVHGEQIATSIGLPVRSLRSAGAKKITRSGRELGGNYEWTAVRFSVSDGVVHCDHSPFTEFLERALDDLPISSIAEVVASGSTASLVIGVYSEQNFQCDFSVSMLARLSSHGIGLTVDFYGGPD